MREFSTGFAGIVVAAVGCAGLVSATEPAVRTSPTPIVEPGVANSQFLVVPDRVPVTAGSKLEARLAALANSIELRVAAAGTKPALVHFDVEGLTAQLRSMIEPIEHAAMVSVHVRDLASQHVLFDYYGDAPLNPASNHKLVTSSAAIDLLGADYTFATRLAVEGDTLYISGSGDPTLHAEDLEGMADTLLESVNVAGLSRIAFDDHAFSPDRFGPGYSTDGPGAAYEAPSGALSLNFNSVEVSVFPLRRGRSAGVSVSPHSEHVVVRSTARIGRRNRISVVSKRARGKTLIQVSGTITRDSRPAIVRRRVWDPGEFTAATLAWILAERTNTRPLAVERGHMPGDAELVATHRSAPLIEVVDSGLAYSNNFMAEQLLRTIAWRTTGSPGDWSGGREVLMGYWSALGNDPRELEFENASGLSRTGRLTTSGLVDLISVAHRTQRDGSLVDALPVAGEPGSLRTRLRLSGKRVRAKTGTLSGVSGLSGVITAEDGTPEIAFSILTNVSETAEVRAPQRRALEDDIVMVVLGRLDAYHAKIAGIGTRGRSG